MLPPSDVSGTLAFMLIIEFHLGTTHLVHGLLCLAHLLPQLNQSSILIHGLAMVPLTPWLALLVQVALVYIFSVNW